MKKFILPLILILLTFTLVIYCATYTSQYPEQSASYVKATTSHGGGKCYPWYATDPTKSLIGADQLKSWLASWGENSNQRFHIDLGSRKVIRRIYYENSHSWGGETDRGVNNFTLWGSNAAGDFADLVYANDGTWVELTVAQNTFDQHVASDTADPKYIVVTNETEYQYYAFKFRDCRSPDLMGVRRIELQTEDGWLPGWPRKWNTKEISKWNTKEIIKWNDLE